MKRAIGAIAALGLASPAIAVGLAPLGKEGLTAGPDKAFYLTVLNPYDQARAFHIAPDGEAALATAGETAPPAITILPATVTIKPGGQRRIMVILRALAPGETRTARVCAQLAQQEGMIHARVCSKLSARRLAHRA